MEVDFTILLYKLFKILKREAYLVIRKGFSYYLVFSKIIVEVIIEKGYSYEM